MNEEQKNLYDYLVEYITDEETAKIIINGGEAGYYYGAGGYVVLDEEEISEALKDEDKFVVSDSSLENSYLVGSAT